ncbi:MAG TPA: TetR/AcrR family transcriptional regulator [Nocardioidaceae bacterium]|nr:TetR/AcrR family transcriptional regulator [Nocardioidaceae bacterium]
MGRRDELALAATDYVLEHGLIGLSLRPLADALGTSDRMLLYHFGSKDDLIATILRTSNDRSISRIRALPASPGIGQAVIDLWQAMTSSSIVACSRLYVEVSALGLFGSEPYAAVVRDLNSQWMAALGAHLVASGADPSSAGRVASLVDATIMGLFLDMPLDSRKGQRRTVEDLARAAEAIAQSGSA